MKVFVILCNIVMLLFTCLVLVTDGVPVRAPHVVGMLLLLVVPLLSAVVISRGGARYGWPGLSRRHGTPAGQKEAEQISSSGRALSAVAFIGNILMLAYVCWSFLEAYPHPEEEGFIPYVVVIVITPVLNLVTIGYGGVIGRLGSPREAKV